MKQFFLGKGVVWARNQVKNTNQQKQQVIETFLNTKKTLRKVRKIKKKSATTVGSRLVSAFKDFLSLNLVHYSISKSKKNKFQTII